jgi:glycosyltransferase involved in cell wall biosynthesis
LKRVVVAIYIDPDFYPPTINAIINLASAFEEVVVVSRNNSDTNYPFPSNVLLKKVGKYCSVRDSEKKSTTAKIFSFLHFTYTLFKYSAGKKTKLVVLYDPFPLFSFFLFRKMISKKKKIWYHNHDMPSLERQRKYSTGWFSATYEHRAMEHIHFFSLPSYDRQQYYPEIKKHIPVFIIPNYPSLQVYNRVKPKAHLTDTIRIIFQGFISAGHSLEEMVALLAEKINGKQLHLILKGSVKDDYKNRINELASTYGVLNKLTWVGVGPYSDLPDLTNSCHIGNAIHRNTDIVSKTLGTASNKIYEYAASGLPVILYDIDQFKKYLNQYSWTFFCNGSKKSIREVIENICINLPQLQQDARMDFENKLNFENHFNPAMDVVKHSLES